jgi:hypothetical protein
MIIVKVKFSLKVKGAVIANQNVEYLELSWQEELTRTQLAAHFHSWLNDQTFIERKMPDLVNAEYCQLFINPT